MARIIFARSVLAFTVVVSRREIKLLLTSFEVREVILMKLQVQELVVMEFEVPEVTMASERGNGSTGIGVPLMMGLLMV